MLNRQDIKKPYYVGLIGVLITGLLWGVSVAQDGDENENEPRILDEIVAKVNTEIITLTDLNKSLNRLNSSLMDDFPDPTARAQAFEEGKQNVLLDMIYNMIMLQKIRE